MDKDRRKKVYPSAKSYLGKNLKEGSFFGPFPNGYAVRDALKLIQKPLSLETVQIRISRIEADLAFNMRSVDVLPPVLAI